MILLCLIPCSQSDQANNYTLSCQALGQAKRKMNWSYCKILVLHAFCIFLLLYFLLSIIKFINRIVQKKYTIQCILYTDWHTDIQYRFYFIHTQFVKTYNVIPMFFSLLSSTNQTFENIFFPIVPHTIWLRVVCFTSNYS